MYAEKIISRHAVWRPLRITFIMICVSVWSSRFTCWQHYICSLSLVIYTRTTYTSSSLRVGQKLCRKSDGLAYEKCRKSIPLAYHMPKNRPPGIRTPNSKSLTEALIMGLLWNVAVFSPDVLPDSPTDLYGDSVCLLCESLLPTTEPWFVLVSKIFCSTEILVPHMYTKSNRLHCITWLQTAIVFASENGLKVSVEDAKCVLANAFVQATLFQLFILREEQIVFKINLTVLMVWCVVFMCLQFLFYCPTFWHHSRSHHTSQQFCKRKYANIVERIFLCSSCYPASNTED